MTERRRGLGRGLGALIPTSSGERGGSPSDVFFPESVDVSRETSTERTVGPSPAKSGKRAIAPVVKEPARTENSPRSEGNEGRNSTAASRTTRPVAAPAAQRATQNSGSELRDVPGAEYGEIPLDLIRPNPKQPRTVFDPDELAELVASIDAIGVLQPVVVRRISRHEGQTAGSPQARFELVMGERRWRASQAAGLKVIPAIVKETADDDLLRDALLENLHRSQLNPLEEAAAYQQLLEDFGCTHDELASRIGRSRPQISNTLRLLRLPPLVARRVAAGVLSAGHARALLRLDDRNAIEQLAQRIVAEGLSVRSVEEIVSLGEQPPAQKPAPRRQQTPDARLDDMAARLSDRFDTRVSVSMGRNKGKMTVEFASVEDLQRIINLVEGKGS